MRGDDPGDDGHDDEEDTVGYEHLSESTKNVHRDRARRREQRLTRAERRAKEEARGARFCLAELVDGPWDGRVKRVELTPDGLPPATLAVIPRPPIVDDITDPGPVQRPLRYRLDEESLRAGRVQYLFSGES